MTAQIPDRLIHRGRNLNLCAAPLEDYLKRLPKARRPKFLPGSTANWRGYVATWEIIGQRLFLTRVEDAIFDVNGEPKAVSWARMRREVLADVRQLQGLLENHARRGLPEADIQVIRRGKALEYFSQHYGKVYVDEGRPIKVKDALVGINQLIDEDANKASEPPPVTAEPITRQFLRIFDGKTELARDQMQKMLRGSGIAPDEFVNRDWAREEKKVFYLNDPLTIAQDWQGRHRRKLSADLDQTFVLMGACYDGSGINAADTLKNENFKPHAALKSLLEWMSKRGQTQQMRNAASRALSIYNNWAASNKEQVQQLSFFLED